MSNTHVVIMAGGIGSRFWPMSTPDYPKQFIDVMGIGKSLIQLTMERFFSICPKTNFWVVTNKSYVEIVRDQLPDIPVCNILAEPEARNTAPCIAYVCWKIRNRFPDANIVVTPSDALVLDTQEFQLSISTALIFTAKTDSVVTIGIKPSRPETGYGYIKGDTSHPPHDGILKVEAFKEKPFLEIAKKYITENCFYWNAGIFVWNVNTIVNAIREFIPSIAEVMDKMQVSFYAPDEQSVVDEWFPTCDKISIDYAVMEKSNSIYVLPADFGWSDLGSWGSLHTHLNRDEQGNASVGSNIKLIDCKGCVVHTADESKVVIDGLDNYIVAEKNGQLLICRVENEQLIKEFSK